MQKNVPVFKNYTLEVFKEKEPSIRSSIYSKWFKKKKIVYTHTHTHTHMHVYTYAYACIVHTCESVYCGWLDEMTGMLWVVI